jgi:ketosteroid isomerase-like protein
VKALRDAGDKVLAIVYQRGRSKGTGITIDMEFAHVWTVREGKVVRLDRYATVAEALEAVAAAGVG